MEYQGFTIAGILNRSYALSDMVRALVRVLDHHSLSKADHLGDVGFVYQPVASSRHPLPLESSRDGPVTCRDSRKSETTPWVFPAI